MATDYFLKLDGIEGESHDNKHKNEIDLVSWSWGESQSGSSAEGGGGGAGKVSMQDFSFSMKINKASPKLLLNCANGDHVKSALLTCRKAGKEQQEYLKITFSDLLVTSFNTGGSHQDEVPTDRVTLNFSKIQYVYAPQTEKGSLGTAIPVGWNLKENVAC